MKLARHSFFARLHPDLQAGMTLVQRIGDHYGVLLMEEQMHSAGPCEGTQVDVKRHGQETTSNPGVTGALVQVEYVSLEEGKAACQATEPRWSDVYRDLAN